MSHCNKFMIHTNWILSYIYVNGLKHSLHVSQCSRSRSLFVYATVPTIEKNKNRKYLNTIRFTILSGCHIGHNLYRTHILKHYHPQKRSKYSYSAHILKHNHRMVIYIRWGPFKLYFYTFCQHVILTKYFRVSKRIKKNERKKEQFKRISIPFRCNHSDFLPPLLCVCVCFFFKRHCCNLQQKFL